jgi:hypothetical protein
MMYAGAATAGVAYWWMARWTRPTNLEAVMAAEDVVVVEAAALMEGPVEPEIDTGALEAEAAAEPDAPVLSEASAPVESPELVEVLAPEPVVAQQEVPPAPRKPATARPGQGRKAVARPAKT